MKPILLGLVAVSSLAAFLISKMAVAPQVVAAPNTGSISSGVFHAASDGSADLRLEFKLARNVLFNRAGSSEISFSNPFNGKNVALEVTKGEPYPLDATDYLQRLDPISSKLEIPENAKAGVYNVKLIAKMFLCEAVLKVCYREETSGSFEIRVAGAGRDTGVKLQYSPPQR